MRVSQMLTSEDIKRIKDQTGLRERVTQLDKSLSIALGINDKYQRENVALKKRTQEAEGETTIVKAVGMNSPEMRALQDKLKEAGRINKLHQELIEKLKAELSRAKEDHQYDNLVHQKELETLRNPLNKLRNKGLM